MAIDLERVARAIAAADREDYMEDARCYDARARAAALNVIEQLLVDAQGPGTRDWLRARKRELEQS